MSQPPFSIKGNKWHHQHPLNQESLEVRRCGSLHDEWIFVCNSVWREWMPQRKTKGIINHTTKGLSVQIVTVCKKEECNNTMTISAIVFVALLVFKVKWAIVSGFETPNLCLQYYDENHRASIYIYSNKNNLNIGFCSSLAGQIWKSLQQHFLIATVV